MRARLERHVERGAARGLASLLQGDRVAVRTPAGLGPAAADDDAVLDHHGANSRVRPGASEAAPSQSQRELHESAVGCFGVTRLLRQLIFQDAEDHLRIGTIRDSSSPDSSPSTASKSLASRKLRYTDAKRT